MDIPVFDQAYVERLRAEDHETERHFTSYFGDLLQIKLRARLRSPQLVDDARQETFLRVLKAIRKNALDQPERLGAFVNAVCNNVLLEMFRAEGRTSLLPEDAPERPDPAASTESTLVTRERAGIVRKIIDSLPERDRELIYQVFFDERDKDEVCREYGVSRDYLRVLLHRARNRFRNLFPEA
jgi:RNA polymerase sigma-70 factor (ECF subfamily)